MLQRENPGDGTDSNESPVRDEQAALAAAGGDRFLAAELLETLVAGLPQEISQLRALYGAGDWSGIDQAAHRLRGATAYCGVPALDNALKELAQAAKSGDEAPISTQVSRVEAAATRLREEIA